MGTFKNDDGFRLPGQLALKLEPVKIIFPFSDQSLEFSRMRSQDTSSWYEMQQIAAAAENIQCIGIYNHGLAGLE